MNKLFTILFFFTYSIISLSQSTIEGIHYQTLQPVSITIMNGKIKSIQKIQQIKQPEKVYIAPGLFDNQVNGFAGVSFAFGNHDLSAEGVYKATSELWKKGVTSYLATLTTHSREILEKNLSIIAGAINDPKLKGSLAGIHLEGPYINAEDGYRGAHPKAYVRRPDWNEFEALNKASGYMIKTVTIAPELPGAIEFIQKATTLGITMAIGHHNANKLQVDAAVQAGAKIATHLGNGCANMIHRHNNPLWPQLANDDLMISIICDGFHLLPEEIITFYKTKGTKKTIITSDVTSFAALPPGQYQTQTGETVELTPEGKLHLPAQNAMYGSASALTEGIGTILKHTSCSLYDAITMASTNVAKLYKLKDRGELKAGMRGDIILFTLKDNKVKIIKTVVHGDVVYNGE